MPLPKIWNASGLTGGTSEQDMDAITGYADGEKCLVINDTGIYWYNGNGSSGVAESSPDTIAPDDVGAGDFRWELISVQYWKPPEIFKTSTGTLKVSEVAGTTINNTGQSAANTQTLPTCAASLSASIVLPESGVGDFHLKAGASDKIYRDGVPQDNGDKISTTPSATNTTTGVIYSFYDAKTSKYNWQFVSGPNSTFTDGGA